jgi:integration host factor subunit beta
MTKRELIEKLSEKEKDLNLKDAEVIVKTVFDSMTEALAAGDRIEIRGFGSFQVKHRRSREGRNPRTGDKVHVEEKKIPFFKVGKELKERVDSGE